MIAFVTGKFVYKSPAVVHVDVNGVGYEVQISLNTYSKIQSLEKGSLYTWLHIKEDAHTLYGFFDMAEKNIFTQLISVNGVGTSAERIVIELRDKMCKTNFETAGSALINNTLEQDALNALVALGIARNVAENAIKKASASAPAVENLETLIKKSLQFI